MLTKRWTGGREEEVKQAKQQDKVKECKVNTFMLLFIEEWALQLSMSLVVQSQI